MRLCDYVIDPVFAKPEANREGPELVHERWQGALSPGSASDEAQPGVMSPRSNVLGFAVEVFAPAVAALTDHEEMVLALVHPLVQVYTIPRTGQLAYVGHICNFRQKVTTFLSSVAWSRPAQESRSCAMIRG